MAPAAATKPPHTTSESSSSSSEDSSSNDDEDSTKKDNPLQYLQPPQQPSPLLGKPLKNTETHDPSQFELKHLLDKVGYSFT